MSAPAILVYNLDNAQKLKLMFVCAQLKLRCLSVPKADYAQPLAALLGMRPRTDAVYAGEGFPDEMLLMANFTGALLNSFLSALRQNRAANIALKAVLTPENAEWDSIRLHDEILREHLAMHKRK